MKKIMKRVLGVTMAAAMTATMLTGCSGGTTASGAGSGKASGTAAGEKTKIEFWTISLQPTFTNFFNDLIKKYEKANPNVTVNWVDLPYESIQQKLVTATAGGTSPDVVNLNTQMTLTLAGKKALVDLEKEASAEQRGIYIKSLYDSTRIGDSAYAFPWYASPNIMFYNKDLFSKAGIKDVPKEYQKAFDDAKTMKEKTGAYLYNPPEFFNLLFEEGIPVLKSDNSAAAFNTDDTAKLINNFKTVTDKGYLPKTNWGNWDNELKLFETQKLAIVSSSGSSLTRIKDEAPDIYKKIGVAEPLTGSKDLSRNALMNLVVPAKSKNHEEAIKFAAYITNDESQLAFCKQTAIFPSTTKASEDSYFTSDTSTLEGQARNISAKVSKTSEDYSLGVEGQGDIQDAVNKIYEATITSGQDVSAALKNAETKVNSLLK